MGLRLAFLGNGPFAVPALARIVADGRHRVAAVVARPDRPQGRHMEVSAGPVAAWAAAHGLPPLQPEDANDPAFAATLAGLGADLLVVADFGQILKPHTVGAGRLGGVNIHGSLLPRHRGAAPVAHAILAGDAVTGVTVIELAPRMDAGAILATAATPIGADETAGELEARLADLGAAAIGPVLDALAEGRAVAAPQDAAAATRAPKLSKADAPLDWRRPAGRLHDQVRALQPWPVATMDWPRTPAETIPVRVLATRALEGPDAGEPGMVLEHGPRLVVQCGQGSLAILTVQPAGKKPMPAADFLRGQRQPAERLPLPTTA